MRRSGNSGVRFSNGIFCRDFSGSSSLTLINLQQGEEAFLVLRLADFALHQVAGAQGEAPDLRRRHVDVLGARQVVVVGRPQEAEAVGQDLQHALAVHRAGCSGRWP